MIADVIRNADSEDALYTLLTSYIEAARLQCAILYLPEQVMRLPLAGCADTNDRFSLLVTALDAAPARQDERAQVVLMEALHVFGAAVFRLTTMRCKSQPPLPQKRRAAHSSKGSITHAA